MQYKKTERCYFPFTCPERSLAVSLIDRRILNVNSTCTITFMGSVVTRGWLSMAPGRCAAVQLGKWPLALEKHWLLLSETLWCRAKQTSVAEELMCGVRPEEDTNKKCSLFIAVSMTFYGVCLNCLSTWYSNLRPYVLLSLYSLWPALSDASDELEILSGNFSSWELGERITIPALFWRASKGGADCEFLMPPTCTDGCSTTMDLLSC